MILVPEAVIDLEDKRSSPIPKSGSIEAWFGSDVNRHAIADERIQLVGKLVLERRAPGADIMKALEPLLKIITSGPATFPLKLAEHTGTSTGTAYIPHVLHPSKHSEQSLPILVAFVSRICDRLAELRLLEDRELWQVRKIVWIGAGHYHLDYYRGLVEEEGHAKWSNGLRRAEQFVTLLRADYSPKDMDAFIAVLDRESRSEGSFYTWMLIRARAAKEQLAGPPHEASESAPGHAKAEATLDYSGQ